MKKQVLLWLILGPAIACFSQEKELINTDRPDQSDSPYLVPKGSLQIETGVYFDRDKTFETTVSNVAFRSTLLRFGVNENVELRLISESLGRYTERGGSVSSIQGISPLILGVKFKLAEEKGLLPQIGFTSHVKLRAGSREFIPPNTTTNLRLAFSHTLNEKLMLGYNLGIEWNGETPQAIFLGTISLCYAFTDELVGFAEAYSFFPEHGLADNRVDGGFTYRVSRVVQLDLAGGLGLNDYSPDFFLTSGISFRLFK